MPEDRNPSTTAPADPRLLDLDALLTEPVPSHYRVKVEGVEYPVRQILYLTGQEEADLSALDRAVMEARTFEATRRAMFDRRFKTVRLLVPGLPERILLGLTYDQMGAVAAQAWAYSTEVPPSAGTGAAASADSSSRPVSADSTAGVSPS